MTHITKTLRIATAAAGALLALTLPAAANAGTIVADAGGCDSQTFSQPFLPWADPASYTLHPGGDFESGPAWRLSNAAVVDGNEPYKVGSSADSRSLAIADGGSATSGSICVGIEHPDLRFFATSANRAATLKVEVLYVDSAGQTQSATIGTVTGGGSWAPTAPYPLVVNLLPLLPGSKTPVSFRFSASGGGFQIDDVYVDPYAKW